MSHILFRCSGRKDDMCQVKVGVVESGKPVLYGAFSCPRIEAILDVEKFLFELGIPWPYFIELDIFN